MSEVKTVSETVDAETAMRWLERSVENPRNLREDAVETLARAILTGQWRPGASTIKWTGPDSHGDSRMGDGQHRLWAVVRAQEISDSEYVALMGSDGPHPGERPVIEVPMEVTYNLGADALDVVDTGRPRGWHDVAKMRHGLANARAIGAITRWALSWDNGNPMGLPYSYTPTFPELSEYYAANEHTIQAGLARGSDLMRQGIVSRTVAGVAYVRFHSIDPEECQRFFDAFVDGSNLGPKSPVLALRKRLGSRTPGAHREPRTAKLELVVHGWNAWRADEPRDTIQRTRLKLTNDSFPKPI